MQAIPCGIHHITAMSGPPQRNVDFYHEVLGLRLVKVTVNFDDPGTYHLYYGDGRGAPGSILTFFPWDVSPRGLIGVGQVGVIALSVPAGSLPDWDRRLAAVGVPVLKEERLGERFLSFTDHDGLPLELVATKDDPRAGWAEGPVPLEMAIRGFHRADLFVKSTTETERTLRDHLGYEGAESATGCLRMTVGDGRPGQIVDVVSLPELPWGRVGAGAVHHLALRARDLDHSQQIQGGLMEAGFRVTPVRDRIYFQSVYFREPGGVLLEVATDVPGLAIDESPETLGTSLKLPPWLEARREAIERSLTQITLPGGTVLP